MNGMKKRFEVAVLVFLFLVLAGVVFAALLPEEVSTEGIITVTSANTEYSYVMTGEVVSFNFQNRGSEDIRYSWVPGKVATPTEPYYVAKDGLEVIYWGITWTNPTLYVGSASSSLVIQIQYDVAP